MDLQDRDIFLPWNCVRDLLIGYKEYMYAVIVGDDGISWP